MATNLRGGRGQSLVELALLLPFLIWVCMGIVDLGRVFYADNIAINAARSGVRVATDWRNPDTEAVSAARADAGTKIEIVSVVVTPTVTPPATRSVGSPVTVTVTYNFRPITPLIAQVVGNPRTVPRSATMTMMY